MALDARPINYDYADAVRVLKNLGFTLASTDTGSHRVWKRKVVGRAPVVVGLVDKGHGKLKSVYVKNMIATLREEGLLAIDGETNDDLDD